MGRLDTLKSIVTFGAFDPRPSESYALAATAVDSLTLGRELYQTWDQIMTAGAPNRASWPGWDPTEAARVSYSRMALVYRCVNLIAHSVGTAPVRVYDESQNNESVPDHPMRTLMRRPNPYLGEAAFHGLVAVKAATSGFCVIEKERDAAGNVIALWPLQSAWLRAIPRGDGSHDWHYRVPGIVEPYLLKAEDVIPFRWAETPDHSPYGIGPIQASYREVSVHTALGDFAKSMMDRGAIPVYGLIPEADAERLSQVEVDQLLDGFLARHGGLTNAARPIFMQAIKDIKQLGFDLNQLAYVDLRDLSELAIVQAFGIPATIVQLRVGLQHSQSRANANSDEEKFYRQCIIPFWGRYDDALTLNLLTEFEPADSPISLEFDTTGISFLQDDVSQKAAWLLDGFGKGAFSQHTVFSKLGLALPDTPDFYVRPSLVSVVPAEDPLTQPVAPAQPQTPPPGLQRQHPRQTLQSVGYEGRLARATDARKRIADVATARKPSIARYFKAQGKRIVPKVMEGLAASKSREMFKWTPQLERLGYQFFNDNIFLNDNWVPERIHACYAMESVDWADEDAKLKQELTKLYLLAGSEAFDAAETDYGLTVGIRFDLANPNVKNVVDKLATRVTEIGNQTRADIAEKVSQGLQDGKSVKEIADSLTGMFEETYANRAETIARTESMVAFGEASALGYKQSGQVDRAQIFDNEAHTQDYGASDGLTCATRDGIVVPIDRAMDHIYADHPNGSACMAPVLIGEVVE